MTGEYATADNGENKDNDPEVDGNVLEKCPTDPNVCCGVWAANLDEVYDRLDELNSSHQTLCRLTREAYHHSQQTWHLAKAIDEKVNGLIAQTERNVSWQNNTSSRLDAIEGSQVAVLKQLEAMGALMRGLTTAVVESGVAVIEPEP